MKNFVKILFVCVCMCIALAGQGDPPFEPDDCPPNCSGTPGNCEPCEDPGVPLDGGVSLLIAAGVGLAGKKAYDFRKKKKAEQND